MKLLAGGFIGILLLLFVAHPKQLSAQTPDVNIWNGPVAVNEIGDITVQNIKNRSDCDFKSIKVVKMNPPISTVFGNIPILKDLIYQDQGVKCVIDNAQGTFAEQNYSGSGNTSQMYSLLTSNGSQIFDPAPAGNNVLMISGILGANYNLTLMRNFRDDSWLSTGGINNVEWRVEPREERLKALTGSNFTLSKHAFSSNGKFMAIKYGNVVAKVNLETLELTPVEWRSSWPTATEIAISSDGRYVSILGNGLYVYDSSTCETAFTYGNWENTNRNSYPGCVESRNLQPEVQSAVSAIAPGHDLFKRPDFTPNSASLQIGVGKRVISSSDLLPERFAWKEFKIDATLHQPNVNGYIALGDSFSSGEGDLQGGTWYEPGTDEQGNKDTFEGRNLCHLSRRSYPYLIAKELGYLSGNVSDPITPLDTGLFHSVACSGAKANNIIGNTGDLRLIAGDGDDFENAQNQYRNDFLGQLGFWQPGRIKQLDIFEKETGLNNREKQSPQIITLGIGGNDANFGDTLKACALDFGATCKYAVRGSVGASELAQTIALQKDNLVKTYKLLKDTNPEAKIYVHGYPIFVQGYNGQCNVNVRLNAEETAMAEEGVKYMNAVVASAAREAGVFYVDITNILSGTNLCSNSTDAQKTVNGITEGDDKLGINKEWLSLIFAGLNRSCILSSGCLGNESYHPNPEAHKLYKQALLSQTNNLTTSMPPAVKSGYPLPDSFFGTLIQERITQVNQNDGFFPSDIVIKNPGSFLSYGSTTDTFDIEQEALPGSTLTVVVESTPTILGEYSVPENGLFELNLEIPEFIKNEPGIHEIHLIGTNSYGEQFNTYEQLIVGQSLNDFDGDGILNQADSCISVSNNSVDLDRDGIDDVCDDDVVPVVDPPPPPPPPPPVEPPVQSFWTTLKALIIKVVTKIYTFISLFVRR